MSAASSYLSTHLHPTIKTIEDLVYRTKSLLGSPIQDDELTDSQWLEIVSEALENYTAWGGGAKEEYLIFCADQYRRGCGVKLDELVQVGCNRQFCNQTVVVSSVTSEYWECEHLETVSAYLSVSPFIYPHEFDINDRDSVEFSGTSGQFFKLFYDPKNPWNLTKTCASNCISINPVSSNYTQILLNPELTGLKLDFLNNDLLQDYASVIPGSILDPLSAIPLTALGDSLSSIPVEVFDLSAFYPPTSYDHPPMEACIDVCNGKGYIYPRCDLENISACADLTAHYRVSPSYEHVITTIPVTSFTVTVDPNSVEFTTISSYFEEFCSECCSCDCFVWENFADSVNQYLTTEDGWFLMTEDYQYLVLNSTSAGESSSVTLSILMNVISGIDGNVWPVSALDVSNATHIIINNIPICIDGGLIPLTENNGIYSTINLCNTALCSDGKMYLESVHFVRDEKPPIDILYDNCLTCSNWTGNGFLFQNLNQSPSSCVPMTPEKVKVDVSFYNKELRTEIGEVSTFYSSKYDTLLDKPRKVYGVFSLDNANSTGSYGGFGGDLLFNFDYALLASTFGYNLQGSRINAGMGYDLVTYHLARSFVENTKRLLRYVSYT